MLKFLVIAFGGAVGTLARYVISGLNYKFSAGNFPISTLVVNVSGSFIIGFLWGITEFLTISSHVKMFVFVGVLGGYTTFSTFSLETFHLMRDGEYKVAIMNMILSFALSLASVFLGYFVSRIITSFCK